MKKHQEVWFTLTLAIFSIRSFSRGYSMEINSPFLINTNKCTIPDIPPFSASLNLTRDPGILCTNFQPLLSYTTVRNGVARLHIREEAVSKYFGSPDSIRCCYSYVYRNGTELYPDVGITLTDCIEFYSSVELQHQLVLIACDKSDNNQSRIHGFPLTVIYENVHQVITVPDSIKENAKKLTESTTKKPISVLMVVIDSVSRLNFIRTMPLTRQFILNNNFYEFKGYNKVDDNTFPNAMAFLTGLNLNDAVLTCKPTEIGGLMDCPFIWYKYRDLGYATAYAEDWSPIATFNYEKKGFQHSPTSYYFKPYMDMITYLKPEWQDMMPFCAGPESQGDRILNLAFDFASSLKSLPSFGVFWMNTFSHNGITAPMTMDQNVRDFFAKLKESQVLDESIVILLSDHGIRFGDIINTPRGFYEVRLPMNYVSLPTWFKQKYPVETKNFEENTSKLTSNYDLYMTLQDILTLSGANHTISPSLACPQCRSLFDHIPRHRSCQEAGIPEKWCTCDVNITGLNRYFLSQTNPSN